LLDNLHSYRDHRDYKDASRVEVIRLHNPKDDTEYLEDVKWIEYLRQNCSFLNNIIFYSVVVQNHSERRSNMYYKKQCLVQNYGEAYLLGYQPLIHP